MTLFVRDPRALASRHARAPAHLTVFRLARAFSRNTVFRVPPTGIPKPDPDDLPADSGWQRRLAGILCGMTLGLGATGAPGALAATDNVTWQFGTDIGIRALMGEAVISSNTSAPAHDIASSSPIGGDWGAPLELAGNDAGGTAPDNATESEATESEATESEATEDMAAESAPAPAILQKERVTEDSAPALAEDRPVTVTLDRVVLPDNLRQAILLDPRVEEMSARACQMAHRLGLARAEGRPKITANVTGSRQLASRIKPQPSRGIFGTRRLSPREQEIYDSGAHHREFEHRQKNNIYDGKISVRHTVFDWGQVRNRAEARTLNWQAAQIDARAVMRERSHDLLQLALTLRRSDEVITALAGNLAAVTAEVEAVRARVEAGAGRLSDLREAQLVQLDQEIAINRAEAERDIIIEHLETEFALTAEDALRLTQVFLSRRHPDLAILPADRTDKAHAIRLRARGVTFEALEIRGSRYPKFDVVIDGTIFDMTDYEDEYEVVGKLEMSVPLYDGGTARARLRENAWRENELKSSLDALVRAHGREMEGLAKRFNQMTREETEALARRDELSAQLRSLRERQGKTVSSPLAVARLLAQIGGAEARLAEIRFDRELLRARALLVAEQIDNVLGLSMEDSVC